MIAIIDYGAGNLGSVYKAFKFVGADIQVTDSRDVVRDADALVLPGVGAFTHCMNGLEGVGLTESTKEFIRSGRPFLGICVGLQMLFDESEEMGQSPGLGILPGRVKRFEFEPKKEENGQSTANGRLKVPHIGWNELRFREDAALFKRLRQGDRVYFVHSYYPEPEDRSIVTSVTDYGGTICCAVEKDNIHATQFHPEKSGSTGLAILRNFAALST